MGKLPSHGDKMGMKKGPWTPEEDLKLSTFIRKNGHGCWRALPSKAGLRRCGKSCRLRWINYLSPDIKRGEFSLQEEQSIIQLHALLGNRWSTIASHLPKRTDNEIKNYWNIHLKKKISKMGIDPITHKPKNHALWCDQAKDFANLCHMAQWESARLEAEARALVRAPNPNRHLLDATTAKAPPPQPPPLRPPCLDILKVWVQINSGMVNISNAIFNGFLASNGILDHSQSSLFNADNHCNEVKGIMENSMEVHETTEPIDSIANCSGLPDFVEGYNSPFFGWNVLEDANSNYWGVP